MKDKEELYNKLKVLEQKHAFFEKEIQLLKQDIHNFYKPKEEVVPIQKVLISTTKTKVLKKGKETPSFPFEKLLGENLINKIGIIITIIGVSIGAKYSIEHDLIAPSTRIIIGYLVGFVLLGLGFKLKNKYLNYASVLTSGAYTILYFITFLAYNLYLLLPLWLTFSIMCLLTICTVFTALKLNKQIIAHIGLVGAYAVPLLLSNNNGDIAFLFVYIGIINLGILYIAVKKQWKPLCYNSFAITWLLFTSWFTSQYDFNLHFRIAFGFLNTTFITFYGIFLTYKLIKKEAYLLDDVVLILFNSFLFFAFGYQALNSGVTTENYLGLFSIYNAILHGFVAFIFHKQPNTDKHLQQLTTGLCILFITLTIPIQFNGNWVTILWVGEAGILFWIGRTQQKSFYEKISYPLCVLSFYNLLLYWTEHYGNYNPAVPETRISLFLNPSFLTSVLFIIGLGFINFIHQKNKSSLSSKSDFYNIFSYILPFVLITAVYLAFYHEISEYWKQLYKDSLTNTDVHSLQKIKDKSLTKFRTIWLVNYSLFFATGLNYINQLKVKNSVLTKVCLFLSAVFTFGYLTLGLWATSKLRDLYLNTNPPFTVSTYYIWIRYVSYLFIGFTIYLIYREKKITNHKIFDWVVHTVLLSILSSELINLLDLFTSVASHKLCLSILWAIYSLTLISLGIWKQKQHLRIGAMVLFGIILIKLFLYDISHLGTISKTIVFISLGVILLIISFLYNKYKHMIDTEKKA
ncbi:DUF2339 domain-containing protein [Wenyingzhuangia sp. 1_MG-2023]|nr:DUF2339 domain-containing protein [Wenyingzhuangia sp. 1_MG-2023]